MAANKSHASRKDLSQRKAVASSAAFTARRWRRRKRRVRRQRTRTGRESYVKYSAQKVTSLLRERVFAS